MNEEPRFIERSCAICGSHHSLPLACYTTSPWPVVQCTDCGFVYLRRVPSYASLAEDFPWEVTFAAEQRRRSRSRLGCLDQVTRWRTYPGHLIDRYRSRHTLGLVGNVLDVGCGGSCRVPEGPTPYGIEISAALARAAAGSFTARGGHVVHANAIDGIESFPDAFFAAVLLRSYLEHEIQPKLILEKVLRKLVPMGKVFVRVPDYSSFNRRVMGGKWCGFRFPDHVNYFTNQSLRSLAESLGFSYRRINRFSPFDDNVIAVLRRCSSQDQFSTKSTRSRRPEPDGRADFNSLVKMETLRRQDAKSSSASDGRASSYELSGSCAFDPDRAS